MTLAGIALTVATEWLNWWALAGQIDLIAWPVNASFWGLAARLSDGIVAGRTMADIGSVPILLIAVAGIALAVDALRAPGDRRWVLAFLWSVLLSPLGWIYYLPVALGPLLSSFRYRPALAIAVVIFLLPRRLLLTLALAHPALGVMVGSLCALAVLVMWWTWRR